MTIYDQAAWAVILGLSLLTIGWLVIWAYGRPRTTPRQVLATLNGPEAEATRLVHTSLIRIFAIYGVVACVAGAALTFVGWLILT